MRIGFDVSAFNPPYSLGVRRVARCTVEALEALSESGQLDIEVVRLAPAAGETSAGHRAHRAHGLARAVRAQGLIGVHSFTSAFALRGPGRRVQTIHELPWRHGVKENAGLRHRFWATLGARRADRVICPTEHVARDLGSSTKVRVVAWGADERFCEEPPAGTVDEVVLERYRLGGDPIILCPGAVRAKKNLAAILRGAAAMIESGRRVEVVITGGDTPDLRRDLGLASRLGIAAHVTTLDTIDAEDWPAMLRLASVVPVLSPSEGFALPVLEALRSGTPVVVPPASAQLEVAGEAAIVVDSSDAGAVARGLIDAIDHREERRYALPESVREFTWERTARQIASVWSEIA